MYRIPDAVLRGVSRYLEKYGREHVHSFTSFPSDWPSPRLSTKALTSKERAHRGAIYKPHPVSNLFTAYNRLCGAFCPLLLLAAHSSHHGGPSHLTAAVGLLIFRVHAPKKPGKTKQPTKHPRRAVHGSREHPTEKHRR